MENLKSNLKARFTKPADGGEGKRKLNRLGCCLVAALLLVSIFGLCICAPVGIAVQKWGSIYNEGTNQETFLNKQYVNNQNILDSYLSQLHTKLQVATANTNDLDKVLSDAVKGGYNSICDKGACGVQQGAPFYGAVLKAYPTIGDVTTLYRDIFNTISDGEAAFHQQQSVLIDKLGTFDSWRHQFPQNAYSIFPGLSFPDDNLIARIGRSGPTGQKAEDQMWAIVTASVTQADYQTGTRQDQETPIATPSK